MGLLPHGVGRIRRGHFRVADHDVQLRLNHLPDAIHGTVFERPWQVDDPMTLSTVLGEGWPFAGFVVQRFTLRDDGLEVILSLHADEPMPAAIGWHPWFRRRLASATGAPAAPSAPVELHLDAAWMYERDAAGLPTGELIAPPVGPWDDCFTSSPAPAHMAGCPRA